MNSIITTKNLTSQDFATLIEANLIERSLYFPRLFKGQIHGPNPYWFIAGPPLLKANGIVRAVFAPEAIEAGIIAALAPFRTDHLNVTWWVGPSSTPQNLGKYLQQHGLKHNRDMMGMAMDLHHLPPPDPLPGLTVERIRDKATLSQWYNILAKSFPMSFEQAYLDALALTSLEPDAVERHFIARLNGEIVAISSVFFGGGVAGLYNLATLPQARSQGIGAWLTIKTYEEALSLGYHVATLQTTYPNALRLYHHLGFEVYCKIGIYEYHPGL